MVPSILAISGCGCEGCDGELLSLSKSPNATHVQAELGTLRDVSPSLRGPPLSSTDEGLLVNNGVGFVVDRSNPIIWLAT